MARIERLEGQMAELISVLKSMQKELRELKRERK